jgi:F420-0:gamma-glutamyl ligase
MTSSDALCGGQRRYGVESQPAVVIRDVTITVSYSVDLRPLHSKNTVNVTVQDVIGTVKVTSLVVITHHVVAAAWLGLHAQRNIMPSECAYDM